MADMGVCCWCQSILLIQTAVAVAPFRNGELAMSAFAANDRFGVGGNLGLSLSLTHRVGS
jgi:hypothetical protein